MAKHKFINEYEIHASPKRLYSYIHTAGGLEQWFATKVEEDAAHKVFNFIWDNEDHFARLVTHRTNKLVKFEFMSDDKEKIKNANYIEFRLEHNEMTDSTFLKVTDYSEMENEDDLNGLWDGLMADLREVIGG